MSEVASLARSREYHSAWFYRELYLHDETRYEKFLCPFCGIKVFPVLIYEPAGEELSRSPHFRKSEEHRHGCDGNPAKGAKDLASTGPVRKIEKQLFTLPTRLIDYVEPPARADRDKGAGEVTKPSPEEVKKRRIEASETHHRARFSVALVQSLAEAHLGTIRQSYQLQEKKNWTDKQRQEWLKAVFSAEIDLRGATMRFSSAFHNLYFPIRSAPRVYYGSGRVREVDEGYLIEAGARGRANEQDNHGLPFKIWVRGEKAEVILRGARRELMAQLSRAAKQDFLVNWYGLGCPARGESSFDLRFDTANLTDLFIRRQPGKNAQSTPKAVSQPAGNRSSDHRSQSDFSEQSGIGQSAVAEKNPSDGYMAYPVHTENSTVDTQVPLANSGSESAGAAGRTITIRSATASPHRAPVKIEPVQRPHNGMRRVIELSDVGSKARTPLVQAELETVPSQPVRSIERAESVVDGSAVNRPSRETDSQIRRSVWLAAVQKEFDAVCAEQTEAAARVVTTFRANVLIPHQERKPLLFGRSTWKVKLAGFEADDRRNVAHWKRLQQRQLTSQEADAAMKEAERRVNLRSGDNDSDR
ncbi:hypothetical protein [Burkholderia sp. BCC0405]|uniref:hypothetical protein n=1 Tax=Burkholderia sp. BCC0405 TaxID=2676298 RepID=UPI00158AC445|nr:hypothetical protein [Burkholderia sp. BCC0405]